MFNSLSQMTHSEPLLFSECQMAFVSPVFSCHMFEVPASHLTLTVRLCKTTGLAGWGIEVDVIGGVKKRGEDPQYAFPLCLLQPSTFFFFFNLTSWAQLVTVPLETFSGFLFTELVWSWSCFGTMQTCVLKIILPSLSLWCLIPLSSRGSKQTKNT